MTAIPCSSQYSTVSFTYSGTKGLYSIWLLAIGGPTPSNSCRWVTKKLDTPAFLMTPSFHSSDSASHVSRRHVAASFPSREHGVESGNDGACINTRSM